MRRLSRATAKRAVWGIAGAMMGAVLGCSLFPAARTALGIVLAALWMVLSALLLTAFRCPECSRPTRMEDKICPRCGAKLEE